MEPSVEFRNYGVDAISEDGAIPPAPVNPAQTVLIRKMADMAPFRLDNEISNINSSNLSVMAATTRPPRQPTSTLPAPWSYWHRSGNGIGMMTAKLPCAKPEEIWGGASVMEK